MVYRVLIVEDDQDRADLLCSWFPKGFRGVVVRSAGTALGVLERTEKLDFAAVMLDHDLRMRALNQQDWELDGNTIIELLTRKISREIPILVHSTNPTGGPAMADRMKIAGFDVNRIPMYQLTKEWVEEWLEAARENYEGLVSVEESG